MIKTISYWSLEHGLAGTHPIEDALAEAKAAGFTGLELCIAEDGAFSASTSEAECREIRRKIDDSGMIVETVAAGFTWGYSPTSDDKATREKSISLYAATLERAAWVEAKAVLFVPGVVKSPISEENVRYDVVYERAGAAVGRLLETAEKTGVNLCVENVWNGLFYSPLEFASFIDGFGHDRLGIYFDVGNVLGLHQHPPYWIALLGERIRRIHIKDFKQSVGTLDGFCDLMAGDVPWAETMAALRGIGYDKTVVAEMMPWDPSLLARTSAAMDTIFAM
ncbi:MAG: xylose isomerase [Phycisphaeraceae bacterium]|nr:xylose isomerase [Phycisphaeraceae bacterium]